jgi:hypothetical protein
MGEDLERRGARVEVQALRCGLEPRVQVARPGSLLVVREEPGTGHRLIAYRDGNPLSGGPLAAGRLRALDRPGTVDVRCASGHEWEVAWVHVTEAPFVAVSDADGRFAIPGVPRGRYTLRAWHPYLGKVEAPIEVEPAEPSGIVVAFSGRGIIDALYPGDAVEVP